MQFNKSILSQLQSMMQKMQEEMAQMKFEGSAGNGKVKVVCNGLQEVLSIKIDPEFLKYDPKILEDLILGNPQILEDLILVAVNDALNKSKEAGNNTVAKMMANMNLPNLF